MAWEISPSQYGSYNWLRREVCDFMDFGSIFVNATHEQQGIVDAIIQSGLQRVFFPPPFDGQPATHRWSYLQPLRELTPVTGQDEYDLPQDVNGVIGGFTYQTTSNGLSRRIPVVNEIQLRQIKATAPQDGNPRVAAIRTKVIADVQVLQVVLYPTPLNPNYNLEYTASITPQWPLETTDFNLFPVGGIQHAELYKASCLAVAEERKTKSPGGPWSIKFETLLKAALAADIDTLKITIEDTGIHQTEDQPTGLGINKLRLKTIIGRDLGFGQHTHGWTHNQSQDVDRVLETGLRKFYNPLSDLPHEWSFLCPVLKIRTVADKYIYQLPADFAQLLGPITHAEDTSVMYRPIELIGEEQIRQKLQTLGTGTPQLAALRSRPADDVLGGTAWDLLLWPVPDGTWNLTARYRVNASSLFDEQSEPYGGQWHYETIIAAVQAAAEEFKGISGIHSKRFPELLKVSIKRDQKAFSSQTLGYAYDPSDRPIDSYMGLHEDDSNVISYNGQYY